MPKIGFRSFPRILKLKPLMDVRLSGGSATPGIQSIMDATAHLDRKKEEAACRKDELKGVVLILPKKGQMAKGPVAKPITPAAVYIEAEEERILQALQEELKMVSAPILNRKWCTVTTAQLVDYLLVRGEEGMGPSVPEVG